HDVGVIHRDLKPDNVLLAKNGRVLVTDFGIARAAQGGEASRTFGGFVGTPAYMAPEQVEGGEVDGRTDVFAFGAMLYEMLTGTIPWAGESPIAVAAARLLHDAPDPRALRPDAGERLAELVKRCLARNRENRPASMAQVAAAFATITATRAQSTAPPPRFEPALASADKRVAVLPFRNSGASEHEYVADGITDDLIDLLSVARGLRVCSRGVVAKYKNAERDAREIGRDLDVQVVVEGTIKKMPGSFRITARVISVADGLQLWAKRFDGAEADMLTMNDEVARHVADALTADLGREARPNDTAAVDLYLRARLQYLRNYFGDAKTASDLFVQALARAPDDPRIIAGYVMARARDTLDDEQRRALRADADRAVRLAPSLPETHLALGAVLFQSLDEVGAMRSFRRALRLNANSAEAHDFLGRALQEIGGAEARRHLEIAITLEPTLVLPRMSLVREHALALEWERVDELLAAAAEYAEPRMLVPHVARFLLWRKDKRAAAELLPKFDPDALPLRAARTLLRVTLGEDVPANELFVPPPKAGQRLKSFYAQLRAEVRAFEGAPARALEEIETASALTLYDLAWLDRCPLLDSVRSDPRYRNVRATVAERAAAVRAAYDEP
ncbi:MAG TPA: protein kinase, partial [Polyangiaceae bacterium]|nr:protein kinase [Polyangiaceae bacterium]